jgi:hypothetical protein
MLAALAVAVACLSAGLLALTSTGPAGAVTPESAAGAPDGAVHVVGTVDRVFVDAGTSQTHLVLRGAPTLDFLVAGATAGPFAPGDYVDVTGQKQGGSVAVDSLRVAVDPVDRAAPWLAVAAVLLAGLAWAPLAFLAGRLRGPKGEGARPLARLRALVPRRAPSAEEGPPPPAQ